MLNYIIWAVKIGIVLCAGYLGYHLGTMKYRSYLTKEAAEVVKAEQHEAEVKVAVITKYMILKETVTQKIDPIIREVQIEIEKPIYNECVVPDTGVMLLNASITQANAALSADGAVQ